MRLSQVPNMWKCAYVSPIHKKEIGTKAFDSVPHSLLIHKLKTFGFNGDSLSWLKSYLTGRKQQVVIEGAKSSWLSVTSGVPQGSILGLLLFLLYINDMPDVVSFCSISLFADDAKCFFLNKVFKLLCSATAGYRKSFNVELYLGNGF